jgi:hypothetical protein
MDANQQSDAIICILDQKLTILHVRDYTPVLATVIFLAHRLAGDKLIIVLRCELQVKHYNMFIQGPRHKIPSSNSR